MNFKYKSDPNADKEEGVKKSANFADIINGCPQTISLYFSDRQTSKRPLQKSSPRPAAPPPESIVTAAGEEDEGEEVIII